MGNTIHLKGDRVFEQSRTAGATLTPGQLVMINSSNAYVVHATSGGYASRTVVEEDALQGKTIAGTYSSGDLVAVSHNLPGGESYVFLKAGENVEIGDHLISGGDGTLIKTTGTPTQIMAVALEALNLSASGAVATRMRVRWM
jgi:hypothetical protein